MKNVKQRNIKNKVFTCLCYFFSMIIFLPLFFILIYMLKQGLSALSLELLTGLPKPVGETGGGISNAIVGSLMLIVIASILSIPIGISSGIFLVEYPKSKLGNILRLSMDVLHGIPSIVIGIVAYIWVVMPMGSFSAFSGGVALGLMMIPIIARTTEETLKLVPKSLKEASLALGVPYYRTIRKVVLKSGLAGVMTGIVLSIARIAGETAPLLFTSFGNSFMAINPLKPIQALPLIIFNYATSPYEEWQMLAWGAALLLIAFIFMLSLITKVVIKS